MYKAEKDNYSSALEGCTNADGPTEICMQSTEMANARAKFEACAGYDILFEGPMCTAEQVDMVEALVPSPFYTFAHCEYNPQTLFCSAIAGYMQAISDLTDKECAACYSEFKEALSVRYALAESELTDVDVCAEDVLAEACLVYLTEALRNFETCAGKAMIIRGPN